MIKADILTSRQRTGTATAAISDCVRAMALGARSSLRASRGRLTSAGSTLSMLAERADRAMRRRDLLETASVLKQAKARVADVKRRIEDHRVEVAERQPQPERDDGLSAEASKHPSHDIGLEVLRGERRRREASSAQDHLASAAAGPDTPRKERLVGALAAARSRIDQGLSAATAYLARFVAGTTTAEPSTPPHMTAHREEADNGRGRDSFVPVDRHDDEHLKAFDEAVSRLAQTAREDIELLLAHLRIAVREKRVSVRRIGAEPECAAEDISALSLLTALADRPAAAGIVEAIASDAVAPSAWQRTRVRLAASPDLIEHEQVAHAMRMPVEEVPVTIVERLSILLDIFEAINTLLPLPERAGAWVRKANGRPLFGGRPPLSLMMESLEALRLVRQYLRAEIWSR